MRNIALNIILVATFASAPALAADPWGIENEKVVSFPGKVVDLLCTLKYDCPPDCGGGKRQLGVLTEDGKLRAAVKSSAIFAGATVDLLPYCGKTVMVDGLLIENPAINLLMVQNLRTSGSEAWKPAEAFITKWEARNGKAEEWFRADPDVKAVIARDGVYGIRGLEPKK